MSTPSGNRPGQGPEPRGEHERAGSPGGSPDWREKLGRVAGSMEEGEEGPVAEGIESWTSRLPSDTFLWSALGAMGASMALRAAGRPHAANFVGQWVPTILIFGLYNKMVKIAGHDREELRAGLSRSPGPSYRPM